MKVGILTASRTDNNGTDLQSVAMMNLFKSFGVDVCVINYCCKKIDTKKNCLFPLTIRKLVKFPINYYNKLSHRFFRKKTIGKRGKVLDIEDLAKGNFDVIVVGSDQIWNLKITGNDMGFFLPFRSPNLKKYSYAASLGVTDLSEWEEQSSISQYLKDFLGVSVREESGIEALKKIGIKARCDLDPILMGNASDWEKLFSKKFPQKPYLLYYSVEENIKAEEYAKNYAKENGLIFLQPSSRILPESGVKTKRFVSVEQWLTYVNNAKIVFTNSYHCLSFSVLLKKDMCVFLLKKSPQSNTRMTALLHRINLQDRIWEDNLVTQFKNIDWEGVEEILNIEREKSKKYIKSMIQ